MAYGIFKVTDILRAPVTHKPHVHRGRHLKCVCCNKTTSRSRYLFYCTPCGRRIYASRSGPRPYRPPTIQDIYNKMQKSIDQHNKQLSQLMSQLAKQHNTELLAPWVDTVKAAVRGKL